MIVEVYATKGGEYLGMAKYLGDVRIATVTSLDVGHAQYTSLRASGEKTESYEFVKRKQIFYGFEYFVRFSPTQLQ